MFWFKRSECLQKFHSLDLNTSYVLVQENELLDLYSSEGYLNTSYVLVQAFVPPLENPSLSI